ncbi:hypothetical protein [Streptomyces rochei]|uniref:hypothetical protein n=1 Tax=Streptomyces rochei TaxID=1928 RepID=UPI003693D4E9
MNPDHVMRTDQTIVPWSDVPVAIQKKILSGTMTEEDWDSDWDRVELGIEPPADPFGLRERSYNRSIEDIVSEALNELPVAKLGPRHVHVFRKEYDKCLLKGCDAKKSHKAV